MATFRAIHPFVREKAFDLGFEPVPGDNYRVRHPRLKGKRAQVAFYKAFSEASVMPGVRRVATPGTKNGTTLLFPQVPESRWEAARLGVAWNPPRSGTIGDLIREKLGEKAQSVEPAPHMYEGRTVREEDCPDCNPAPVPPAPPRPRNLHFNGAVDDRGCVVNFQVTTSDDGTARLLLGALRLGS